MKLSDLEKHLVAAMESWEIIDCHEHLGPESRRLGKEVDVFTLFAHYTRGDLAVARMSQDEYQSLFNQDIPLERRWAIFAPYWEQIRWGSYARAALLAAKKFYGADDINEDTYQSISAAMKKANTPGIYERILKEACNIRTSLTQCGSTDLGGTPLLTPVMPMIYEVETWAAISRPKFEPDAHIRSVDDFLDAMRRYVVRVKGEGAVGLKMMSNPFEAPSREDAMRAFRWLQTASADELPAGDSLKESRDAFAQTASGEKRLPKLNPLRDYIVDETIKIAAEEDMVVCVHTGYWGDFRTLDPLHLIPILQRHPDTRFDVYHLGYPWMREALMLGKGFPNVWLNLCWTHIISQQFVVTALNEAIDLIPMNKILAFGGDYGTPVEKVYGHLVMAREDIARVLAGRIEDGQMSESQALAIAKKWFWDNPVELYKLDV